jgi:uncharacterized membrane protein YeaQ/YmgE (transglycosylase-associated protein family)
MEEVVLIIAVLVFGLAAGWIAQMLLGQSTKPNAESLVAGLVGSFVGGLIGSLLAGDGLALRPSGIIGSIVGAVAVLYAWHAVRPASSSSKRKRPH